MYWDWTQAIYAKAIGFQMKLMMGEAMCCFHHFMPTLSREVFSLLRVITSSYSAFQLVGLDRLSRQPHCTASILSRHDQCAGPWYLWRLSSCSAYFIAKPLLLLINAENCKLSNTGTMQSWLGPFDFSASASIARRACPRIGTTLTWPLAPSREVARRGIANDGPFALQGAKSVGCRSTCSLGCTAVDELILQLTSFNQNEMAIGELLP